MRKPHLVFVPLLLAPLLVFPADRNAFRPRPFDWPQWQGPQRDGASREPDLLDEWPKDGPKPVWQANELGAGYSTPTVAAGRVFCMGNRGGKERVVALAEADGRPLWQAVIGPERAGGGGYPGPRCSPTVDGDRVYGLGLNGDLVCLNCATGKVLWAVDLVKDYGGSVGGWGYSESPLIDGDRVLCTPGGSAATVIALHKATGKLDWKCAVPQGDQAHYASIIAAEVEGRRQYVQFLSGGVVGLAANGGFLWRYDAPANGTANCSTAVYADGQVFAASGYGTGGGLVRLVRTDDGYDAKQVYFTKKMKNHHGGMVLRDGYLYGSDEGLLTCLEFKTGRVQWADRAPGKGSIAYADGRLYYRDEGGPVVLVEANPKEYVERGRFTPPGSGSPAWPHPVVANGRLYLRDQDVLRCYDVKAR